MEIRIDGVEMTGEWQGGDARDDADPGVTSASLPPGLPPPPAREGENRNRTWERLRKEARAAGMNRRSAYIYANEQTERLFPHVPPPPPEPEPPPPEPEPIPEPIPEPEPPAPPAAPEPAPSSSSGGVEGLGNLPSAWPTLPPNASLAAEVAWVQGNRVLVVQGGAVDLSRALSPAPSYAAIAWLETSILYPSKFADVTVKAGQDQQDAAEDVRRERLALADLQGLLSEAATASE